MTNKTKQSFFKRNYSACKKFFEESKWYFILSLAIFAFFFLVGFTFPIFFRTEIFNFIAKMIATLEGKSAPWLVQFIFLNNLKASFLSLILGIFIGLFPLAISIVNGYLIGFVARETVALEGITILWKLIPHGIFELPAIIMSVGIGFKIGIDLFRPNQKVNHNFKEGLRFFVFVIFPLLLIAAIIEGILIGLLS